MEKHNKKVIISLVVGIITFVLLVTGATFAYFQATNTASGTTNIQGNLDVMGTIVVNNPTENLYLKLSSFDMQESYAGTSYYASNNKDTNYTTSENKHELANYTISGGTDNAEYYCEFKLNVSKPSVIKSGDMTLKLSLDNATIDGSSNVEIDLATAKSSYVVKFHRTGNSSGNLIKGDIIFNNTNTEQNYIINQPLRTVISNSDIYCQGEDFETHESICRYDTSSTVAEGEYGAKYNCKVDPNKPEYTFYLLDNNEDGTSDLIMNANINAAGEAVIPGVTEDTGLVAWQSSGTNVDGPVDAMTYLYNATKSWTNVEPLTYTYNDREYQGITTDNGYESFISNNGIGIITKGDTNNTQVTIGNFQEPLRTRLLVYSSNSNISEVKKKSEAAYLYDNLNFENILEIIGYTGYWSLSSISEDPVAAWIVQYGSSYDGLTADPVEFSDRIGVRPVINVRL